jgi:hypothetical protein
MPFSVFQPLQTLVDLFEEVLLFFHGTVGLSWGFSIIALTVAVRILLVPLAIKQAKSMRGMQLIAPEIKALQAKYKDDKQRLNQEMMEMYKKHQVNPFGSCLPLLAQMPVFISLFYLLREDLKTDICGPSIPEGANLVDVECGPGLPRLGRVLLHPGPHGGGHGRRARRAHPHVHRLAAALEPADDERDGRQDAALHHARAAVRLHRLHPELPGRPDRLLDHHEPVDRRSAVHIRKTIAPPVKPLPGQETQGLGALFRQAMGREEPEPATTNGGGSPAKSGGRRAAGDDASAVSVGAKAGSDGASGPSGAGSRRAGPPAQSPRKKKRKTGRRR